MRNPDLAPFAMYVSRHDDTAYVVWMGQDACAYPRLAKEFMLLGVDRPDRVVAERARVGGTWLAHDFERSPLIIADPSGDDATVVCNGLLANPRTRTHALRTLTDLVDRGATAIVTVPGPHSGRGDAMSSETFIRMLCENGLPPTFVGRTAADDATFEKTTLLALVNAEPRRPQLWRTPPPDFRVVAMIVAFNEADVVEDVLEYLIGQGVEIYFFDNWSSDDTAARVAKYLGRGVIEIERLPIDDTASYDLERILIRMEQLSSVLDADWFIDYDADEIRRSAFRGVDLRTSIYAIDRLGYNAIDFTVMNFRPIDDTYVPGTSLERHFTHFEFGKTTDHLRQRKAWKNLGRPVYLTERAGHDVLFRGRNVYPYKFMNRHYPIQSQEHGERKVLRERIARYNRRELRLRKWHTHYAAPQKDVNFLVDEHKLVRYDPETFHEDYLIERLTGIGSDRSPGFVELYLDHHGESV